MTLEPSRPMTEPIGESMLSAADSPALISATPPSIGPDWTEAEADCSTSLSESFARWDRDLSCWRTYQRCLIDGWVSFCDRWPTAGLMLNGDVFALPNSELP